MLTTHAEVEDWIINSPNGWVGISMLEFTKKAAEVCSKEMLPYATAIVHLPIADITALRDRS